MGRNRRMLSLDMKHIISNAKRFLKSEDGPTTVEYAVMLALVVALVISVVAVIGTKSKGKFEEFDQKFNP